MDANIKNQIQAFYAANQPAIDALADAIGVPGIWFCCLFYNESGLNPGATNSTGGAVGLNQMMPATLAGLGITASQYISGGVAYQCQVMQKYFASVSGIIKRAGDLYLFDFWPAAIINNYAADFAIGVKNGTGTLAGINQGLVYSQNSVLDFNGDGIIDRQDFWDGFEAKYDELLDTSTPTTGYFINDLWIDLKTNYVAWILVLILVVVVIVMIYNKSLII